MNKFDENFDKSLELEMCQKFNLTGKIAQVKKSVLENELINPTIKGNRIENLKQTKLNLRVHQNCVFIGKWIYEVLLLSNMDIILGWTQFNNRFTDLLSNYSYFDPGNYGLKAYDKTKLQESVFSKIKCESWNIGDVIGVGIDLDQKFIEFFLNGKSMGKIFEKILTGENKAYFPNILLTYKQKINANFGQEKFFYDYSGYEKFDLPEAEVKNIYSVTNNAIQFFETYYFEFRRKEIMPKEFITGYFKEIFCFFGNFSLVDDYCIIQLFIPFLINNNNIEKNENFNTIFSKIYFLLRKDKREDIFLRIIKCLCLEIEKLAVRNIYENKEKYTKYFDILIEFIQLDCNKTFFLTWIISHGFIEELDCLINFNIQNFREFSKFTEEFREEFVGKEENKKIKSENKKLNKYYIKFFSELNENYKNFYNEKNFNIPLNENKSDINQDISSDFLMPDFVNQKIKKFLNVILFDNTNKNLPNTDNTNSQEIVRENVLEHIFKYYKKNRTNNSIYVHYSNKIFDLNENYIFGFYMNLFELFLEKIVENPKFFDQISIMNWIENKNPNIHNNVNDIYLGGTMNTIKNEYLNKIGNKFTDSTNIGKNSSNNTFHFLINITNKLLIPFLSNFNKNFETVIKNDPIKNPPDLENDSGRNFIFFCEIFQKFNSRKNINNLFSLLYFLIYTLNKLITEEENILYTFPKYIMHLPYEIMNYCFQYTNFHAIQDFDSFILDKTNFFKSKDDFCFLILHFYTKIYSNLKIKNPELREGINTIIFLFVRSPQVLNILNSNVLLHNFINGVLIDLDKYYLSVISSQNLLKLIEPFSLVNQGNKKELTLNYSDSIKNYLTTNTKIFEELSGKLFNNLNKYMSDFMQEITNSHNILFKNSTNISLNNSSKTDTIKRFITYSINFNEYLVLIEMMIKLNSGIFLNSKNLLYTSLLNFLTNISTRLYDTNSFTKLKEILKYATSGSISMTNSTYFFNSYLKNISIPIISIILELNTKNAFEENTEFFNQISSSDLIEFNNFKNLTENIKEENFKNFLNKYNEIIHYLIETKKVKAKAKMTEEEWVESNKIDDLCFICYSNVMDTLLVPCGHKCCNVCLMQYLVNKDSCFLCCKKIESFKTLDKLDEKKLKFD